MLNRTTRSASACRRSLRGPSTIRRIRLIAAAAALLFGLAPIAAGASRPLLDRHQWDAYFALFAKDTTVPWKPTTVRLDTYSGAPVDFAAYAIDPAEVIVAGANRSPRAIDTSGKRAVARWRFSPPAGYRFETSDVNVPLGSSEGFYVIEARRGDATQQVWINRSRIGLVTKESPEGLLLWVVDLGNGRAIGNARVDLLAAGRLVTRKSDRDGLVEWRDARRPTFALVESGASRAFVSLLPQAPLPQTLVGVRVESTVVRAGQTVRALGFVRRRSGGVLRRASGDVKVTLAGRGATIAAASARLDAAGAFVAELPVPANAAAGDYAVLASAAGNVGGTSVRVDAAARLALNVTSACPCDPQNPVPLTFLATQDGAPAPGVQLRVDVVRAPHIVPPGEPDDAPRWGTTDVLQTTVSTGTDGRAHLDIPQPTDGLASTYGIRAATGGDGATATAQVSVPTASVALAIEPDAAAVDVGESAGFEIRGFDATSGAPQAGMSVTVRLSHGATAAQQTLRLDDNGRAHAVFHSPSLGSNLAVVETAGSDGRRALDAASVSVAPRGLSGIAGTEERRVSVTLDRGRYRLGERIGISLAADGATGDALVTLEGARTYQRRIVALSGGRATTSFALPEVEGDVHVGAAAVRDGAVMLGSAPVEIDAAGHARASALALDRSSYAPGDVAKVNVRDGDASSSSTLVVRLADGRPGGGADFDDLPLLLRAGGTSSQNLAAQNPAWHAWVAPARSKVSDIFAAERPRQVRSEVPSVGVATPQTLFWRIERSDSSSIDVPLPTTRGTYVLSVLRVFDDGDVGAASTSVTVR